MPRCPNVQFIPVCWLCLFANRDFRRNNSDESDRLLLPIIRQNGSQFDWLITGTGKPTDDEILQAKEWIEEVAGDAVLPADLTALIKELGYERIVC